MQQVHGRLLEIIEGRTHHDEYERATVIQRLVAAGFDISDELQQFAIAKGVKPAKQKKTKLDNPDTLSSRLKAHIEAATGTVITCGTCIAFLRTLDANQVFDNNSVAKQLAIDVQLSHSFTKKMDFRHKHQKKVEWFATLIEPLIPRPPAMEIKAADTRPCNPPMTFVYPYWHGGARGDELRFSIRSVMQHYGSQSQILVVGDRPPWYSGPMIHQERIRECPRHAYSDMVAKMTTIANHPDVPDEAVWIMDDTYFMHPIDLQELKTPRAYKWDRVSNSDWRKLKTRSMQMLSRRGKPQHDYATHLPHHFEKDKLRELWSIFPLSREPLLWEVLYGNLFYGEPQSPVPFLRRLMSQDDVTPEKLLSSPVVNNGDLVWSDSLRTLLNTRFPEPTEFEIESGS